MLFRSDTAARSDVSVLGKEMAAHFVDATAAAPAITVDTTTKKYKWGTTDLGPASNGVVSVVQGFKAATTVAPIEPLKWCVQVTYGGGTATTIAFGSESGLGALGSTCGTATGVVTP